MLKKLFSLVLLCVVLAMPNSAPAFDKSAVFGDSISKNVEILLSEQGWDEALQYVMSNRSFQAEEYANLKSEYESIRRGPVNMISIFDMKRVIARAAILIIERNAMLQGMYSSRTINDMKESFFDTIITYRQLDLEVVDPDKVVRELLEKMGAGAYPNQENLLEYLHKRYIALFTG